MLAGAYSLAGTSVEIAIGLPECAEAQWRSHEEFLKQSASCPLVVRRLRWEEFPADNIRRMFMLQNLQVDLSGFKSVSIPRDWGWNFVDCDIWFNLADPGQGAVLPLRPTANYVSDLAVRLVPDAYASGLGDPYWDRQVDAFRMWRRTGVIVCSDERTATDLVGYAGVRRGSIMLAGSLATLPSFEFNSPLPRKLDQWVWLVDANERHANLAAIEGLSLYLQEGGLIRPVIASGETLAFERPRTVKSMAAIGDSAMELLNELDHYRYLDLARLSRLLCRSAGLWSSELAGGEGLALTMARRHGLWFLGQNSVFGDLAASAYSAQSVLYPSCDPMAIADGLHRAEQSMLGKAAPPAAEEVGPGDELKRQQYGFVIDRLLEFVSA